MLSIGGGSHPVEPQYRYLGVIFSSSYVFRKASEDAKKKGMKALGSTWSLFCRGKKNDWNAHSKLFHSFVASTILYASHIWASDYLDVIEKVQSRFIRRLFHLDFKTPTYALRLETNSPKLHVYIFKQQIHFVIRVLQMPDSRLTRISFNALRLTQANDHKKYNWVTGLNDSLKKLNFHNLSESSDYLEWIYEKQITVSSLQSILLEDDLRRSKESTNHQHCAELLARQRLTSILTVIGIYKTRIIAQLRHNGGKFYWKGDTYALTIDDRCSF
jgi:hypothetical protein